MESDTWDIPMFRLSWARVLDERNDCFVDFLPNKLGQATRVPERPAQRSIERFRAAITSFFIRAMLPARELAFCFDRHSRLSMITKRRMAMMDIAIAVMTRVLMLVA